MCRNIKLLHHFEPPSTREDIRASALQYVRKVTGMRVPNRANQVAFDRAVEDVTRTIEQLFDVLEVHGPPRSREEERLKALQRGAQREAQLRARYSGMTAATTARRGRRG